MALASAKLRFSCRRQPKRVASRRERKPIHPILRNAPQTTAFFALKGEAFNLIFLVISFFIGVAETLG